MRLILQPLVISIIVIAAIFVQNAGADEKNIVTYPSDKIGKIKQEIEQDEKCEKNTVCNQWAENNMIVCLHVATCIFLTDNQVPYRLVTPR